MQDVTTGSRELMPMTRLIRQTSFSDRHALKLIYTGKTRFVRTLALSDMHDFPRFDDSFLMDALKDQLVQREGPYTGPYTGWAVDSRKVTDDAIFAALAGSQSDGHQFIAAACAKGAKAVLCRTDWTGHPPAGVTFYRVKDPFEALRLLGRKWRSKLGTTPS